jgi:hypothetical protein
VSNVFSVLRLPYKPELETVSTVWRRLWERYCSYYKTNPTAMGIEETSQASPTQRGERPGNRTFVPETPHLDKGKAAAVQPSAAGAVSQTPEARMQQMAEEIEDLKRMNASLVRQLCPSPHGRVNVEGQPFSETDSDEFSADEEERGRHAG